MQTFWRQRIFVYLFALTLIIIPVQGNPVPPEAFLDRLGFYAGRYVFPILFWTLILEFLYRLNHHPKKGRKK